MRLPGTLSAGAAGGPGLLESALRRDRWIVAGSLVLLVVLCWWYLLLMADGMKAMTGEGGSMQYMWLMPMGSWTTHDFVLASAMWIVMMIGMMVPSAAPVILLYAMIARRERQQGRVMASTGVFVAGYLAEFLAGASPDRRLRTAAACRAFALTVPGESTGLPDREELKTLTRTR